MREAGANQVVHEHDVGACTNISGTNAKGVYEFYFEMVAVPCGLPSVIQMRRSSPTRVCARSKARRQMVVISCKNVAGQKNTFAGAADLAADDNVAVAVHEKEVTKIR